MGRDLNHFTEGLSAVFQKMAKALKPRAPLSFTYHHNTLEAYLPVAVAILDAGLTCSATLPCPAEMGASIHINGTGSSIIDTVFVCRKTGIAAKKTLAGSSQEIGSIVLEDAAELQKGNVRVSPGDIRCIAHGHLTRMAIWNLRGEWDPFRHTSEKIESVSSWFRNYGSWTEVEKHVKGKPIPARQEKLFFLNENKEKYGVEDDYIPF